MQIARSLGRAVLDAANEGIAKVNYFSEQYFKEVVFLFGTIVLALKEPKLAALGTCIGLFVPYTENPSEIETVDDASQPFRVRFAEPVLIGAAAALLHDVFPQFRILQIIATLGALGIGICLKRFYIEVIRN